MNANKSCECGHDYSAHNLATMDSPPCSECPCIRFVAAKPEPPKCPYCDKGVVSRGHYDTFHYNCGFCEGTGKQKWKRCTQCNKFGEVDAPGLGFLCSKKCPKCNGTRGIGTMPLIKEEL